jgi:hypothetical protein
MRDSEVQMERYDDSLIIASRLSFHCVWSPTPSNKLSYFCKRITPWILSL